MPVKINGKMKKKKKKTIINLFSIMTNKVEIEFFLSFFDY
jgi:hypothetical protein